MGSRFQNDRFQIPEHLVKCEQVDSHITQKKSVNCTSYFRCTFRKRVSLVAPRRTVHTVTRIWTTRGFIHLSAKWVTTRCNYPQQEHIVSRSIHAYNGHDGSDPQVWKNLVWILKDHLGFFLFKLCFRWEKSPNTSAIGVTSGCNPAGNSRHPVLALLGPKLCERKVWKRDFFLPRSLHPFLEIWSQCSFF